MQDNDKQISQLQSDLSLYRTIVILFLLVLVTSTIFFHIVEKWRWLDSVYFTVVTISTVGYGNIVPSTDLGKIGNMVLIVVGIGIFTIFVTQFIKRQGLRRLEHKQVRKNKK